MRIGSGRGDTSEHVLDQLSAYIDYELADAERERVRDHLRRCPACENELATLRATKQLLTESPLHPVPRSFVLTPEMVGRGVTTGPVERRRSFGWTLAGRLRTASALVAVLLVLILSGDVLSRSGVLGGSSAAIFAPTSSASSAPDPDGSARNPANPTTQALAEATTTAAPPAAGVAVGAEPPAAPIAAEPLPTTAAAAPASPPDGNLNATDTTTLSTSAAPTPVLPLDHFFNPEVGSNGLARPYDASPDTAPAPSTKSATSAPPVNGWQLAEGALLILLLVLGVGALWARARGV